MTQSGLLCFSAACRAFLWWKYPKYCLRTSVGVEAPEVREQCCGFLEAAVCVTMYLLVLKGYEYDSLEEISWKQFLVKCQNTL